MLRPTLATSSTSPVTHMGPTIKVSRTNHAKAPDLSQESVVGAAQNELLMRVKAVATLCRH